MRRLLYFTGLCFLFLACQTETAKETGSEPDSTSDELGEINFQVTGSEEAQAAFTTGMLLLHSFEYEDAREAFQEAKTIDPEMGMAYWGEAMTHNHSLWRYQDSLEALTVLEAWGKDREERVAKLGTDLEKDLFTAAEILYGEGTKYDRDQAYSDHLAALQKKYPKNHEVSALYAISLLGSVPVGRDEAIYEKGARIAQGILDENPKHPGALHYLIHSYDDPKHAPMALQAANSYSKVAPDAAHALHMPSHIYVAMGMWDDVISSNIASWEASLKRKERKGIEDGDAKSYHALHWLMYGYLQQGKKDEARQLVADMKGYMEDDPTKRARAYMVSMKANYLADTESWDEEMADIKVDYDDLNISVRAVYQFLDGLNMMTKGDADSLGRIIEKMKLDRQKAELSLSDKGVPMCSAAGWVSGNNSNSQDVGEAKVVELQLETYLALMDNDQDLAEKLMLEATELETKLSYAFGPPTIPIPTYEMYGNWLLKQGRDREAAEQFDKALEKGPGRRSAIMGRDAAKGEPAEKT